MFIFVFGFAVFLLFCDASTKKSSNASPESKLNQIIELASNSKSNVITLDDSTYSYYVLSKPRPYSLIIFLTATHPKFKCVVCKKIDRELNLVAESHTKAISGKGEAKKLFFIRLDYESSQKMFQNYGLNSVPLLFHSGPPAGGEKVGNEYDVLIRDRFQIGTDPDAESIANFIRDRTGVNITIKRSMFFSYVILIIVFALMAAAVQPVINSLPFWLSIVQSRTLWMMVSAGVYTCAISGLIFDIIRSPQMYYANPQTGQIMFFYPQSGNQFVVEGFVIGFLNLGCAISLICLVAFAPYFKDEQSRTIGIIASIIAFAICFRMIRSLYIMKNGWYGSRF